MQIRRLDEKTVLLVLEGASKTLNASWNNGQGINKGFPYSIGCFSYTKRNLLSFVDIRGLLSALAVTGREGSRDHSQARPILEKPDLAGGKTRI